MTRSLIASLVLVFMKAKKADRPNMNPHVDFLSAFSVGFWPRQLSEKGCRKRRFAKQRKMQCNTQMTDQRACLLIFILCTSGVMSTLVAAPFCLLSTQHVGRMTHTLLEVQIASAVSAPFTSQCVWKVIAFPAAT